MNMPESFKEMTIMFHQGFGTYYDNIEQLYDSAVRRVSRDDYGELIRYVDYILEHDDETLEAIWWKSGADIAFRKVSDLRMVLRELRSRLI